LHRDFVVRTLAFTSWHAFAFSVLQESFFAETTDDTLAGTESSRFLIGAIGGTSGAAGEEFGIRTAFFIDGKSRFGDSEFEDTNAEQQHENKAKGHR